MQDTIFINRSLLHCINDYKDSFIVVDLTVKLFLRREGQNHISS